MSAVLDTSILIDVLRGHRRAEDYLVSLDAVPFCSEVTRAEVLRGLRSDERRHTERLFQQLQWVSVDEAISRAAGAFGRGLRRSHSSVGVADLIIAATAEELDLPLATTNVRHYPMFKGLRPPYPDR